MCPDRVFEKIVQAARNVADFPEMGSPLVRESIVKRYGEELRQIPASTFLIVYRYVYGENAGDVLALVYGSSIM